MIPLRDNIPSSRFPAVTLGIIVVNCLVFLRELQLGLQLQEFLLLHGVIPARYTMPDVARLFSFHEQLFAVFSSMFLHVGGFFFGLLVCLPAPRRRPIRSVIDI